MRQVILIVALVVYQFSLLGQTNQLLIKGGTVYVGTGEKFNRADILITDGRIVQIDESIAVNDDVEVIDMTGKYIMPGMIDAHIHFFQTGFFDSRPDVVDIRDSIPYDDVYRYQADHPERYYEAYLRSGVTGVYDVGGFLWSLDLIESAESDLHAPHVAAAGPLLTFLPPERLDIYNTSTDSVMVSMQTEEQTRWTVARNINLGATGIKIWGYDTADEDFERNLAAANDEARKRNNNLIAHATTLSQAKMALRHGAELLVHGVSDSIVDQEFLDLALNNDAIYNPTLVVTEGYVRSFLSLRKVPLPYEDPHGVVDEKTQELLSRASNFSDYRQGSLADSTYLYVYQTWLLENKPYQDSIDYQNLRLVHDAGLRIAIGTDAGNPGTLHGVSYIKELVATQSAGFAPEEVIVMATKNGAQAMERFDDFGSIEVGKMADIIILDKDPGLDIGNVRSLTHVLRGGLVIDVSQPFDR